MKTDHKFSGFLRDAAYTTECSTLLQTYANKLPGIEELILVVGETPYTMLGRPSPSTFSYSEDGTVLTVYTASSKYYDRKGKVTGVPDAQSIYTGFKHLLDNAVKAHKERIEQKSGAA